MTPTDTAAPPRPTTGPASAIDPRIRRRRVQVKRDEGRRRLRVLLVGLGVLLAAGAVVGVAHSPLLTVQSVTVLGARATDPTLVVQTARLDRHPRMTDIDLSAIDRRLAALPWVRTARAERRWPQSVRITIAERSAIAQVAAEDGQWALLDRSGRVLEVGPQQPDLPTLTGLPAPGPPGAHVEATDALTTAASLPPDLRPRVKAVGVVPEGIDLILAPRGTAHIGDATRLDEKLTAAATVLGRIDMRNLAVLDVRVPEAPVVTRGP